MTIKRNALINTYVSRLQVIPVFCVDENLKSLSHSGLNVSQIPLASCQRWLNWAVLHMRPKNRGARVKAGVLQYRSLFVLVPSGLPIRGLNAAALHLPLSIWPKYPRTWCKIILDTQTNENVPQARKHGQLL